MEIANLNRNRRDSKRQCAFAFSLSRCLIFSIELDALSVYNRSEEFSMLYRLVSISEQVISILSVPRGNLDGEEKGLFVGRNKFFFFFELSNLINSDSFGVSKVVEMESDVLTIIVELDTGDGTEHGVD